MRGGHLVEILTSALILNDGSTNSEAELKLIICVNYAQ